MWAAVHRVTCSRPSPLLPLLLLLLQPLLLSSAAPPLAPLLLFQAEPPTSRTALPLTAAVAADAGTMHTRWSEASKRRQLVRWKHPSMRLGRRDTALWITAGARKQSQ